MEKFVVIKGDRRIYSKVSQIIKNTKQQLSVAVTVTDLIRGDRFGVFDVNFNHSLISQIQCRFLTDISKNNLNALKDLLDNVPKTGFDLKARNPELGLSLFPRMIARDNEEILFFTTPSTDKTGKNDLCLWTNCKTLVQTFMAVFEDLWHNSIDLQTKIAEIKTAKLTAYTSTDKKVSVKDYESILRTAETEIVVMTFDQDLMNFWQSTLPFKEWMEHGVSVKIMVPITIENFEVANQLSDFCEVRHMPVGQMGTTVVDGKHLFQFKLTSADRKEQRLVSSLKAQFYTDDLEYIGKVKTMLDYLWSKARAPSAIMLNSIFQSSAAGKNSSSGEAYTYGPDRTNSPYRRLGFPIERKPQAVTEKEVIAKIVNAKKHVVTNPGKEKAVFYGKQAVAVIHPPSALNLPEMIIQVFNFNDTSSFGAENWLLIHLPLDSPKGKAFMPVTLVQDSPINQNMRKPAAFGSSAGTSIHVFEKDAFQVQAHDNILFVGWTKPIPLLFGKYTLPPSCLLFEGYGQVNSGVMSVSPPGFEQKWEYNGLEAFVTFFHPSSKYSGPGTDGRFSRELILTIYPTDTGSS